jgi:hypothetical protein
MRSNEPQSCPNGPEVLSKEIVAMVPATAGTSSRAGRTEVEEMISTLVRRAVPGQRGAGQIRGIQPKHVQAVIKSRALQKQIGGDRGAKVWGWLARAAEKKQITLRLKTEWTNTWINSREHKINGLRADAVWATSEAQKEQKTREADREEAMGSISTWMLLNEEPARTGFQTLRTEKREAMRMARKHLFSRLGGVEAMYAALALMTERGELMLEQDRGSSGRRGSADSWIAESLKWAEDRGWLSLEVGGLEAVIQQTVHEQHRMRELWRPREGAGQHKILDVGEGWGSIGIAVSQMPEGCSTIGLDRIGFLEQGEMHGDITSRLNLDLCSTGKSNVLRRAAKLAMKQLGSFAMVWLSPECRVLTTANCMNVSKGCTNGRLLLDPRNVMSQQTLDHKKEELRQCNQAIKNQMQALEEENDVVLFAMENPLRSDLWDMEEVKSRLTKPGLRWRLIKVDQCAYGRKCQKPTRIMTNIQGWEPKGVTGHGRCKPLQCGGTVGNTPGPGQGRHEQQMITTDPARKPREGKITGKAGRREYSVRAGKNLVQAELVQEIVRAALECRRGPEPRQKPTGSN